MMSRPIDERPEPRRPRYDRRAAKRRTAADYPAEICWLSAGCLGRTSALLMDISETGTLVLADDLPDADQVLLRLRWPAGSGWVRARLVAGHRTRFGACILRLCFRERPSQGFLATAVVSPAGRN